MLAIATMKVKSKSNSQEETRTRNLDVIRMKDNLPLKSILGQKAEKMTLHLVIQISMIRKSNLRS